MCQSKQSRDVSFLQLMSGPLARGYVAEPSRPQKQCQHDHEHEHHNGQYYRLRGMSLTGKEGARCQVAIISYMQINLAIDRLNHHLLHHDHLPASFAPAGIERHATHVSPLMRMSTQRTLEHHCARLKPVAHHIKRSPTLGAARLPKVPKRILTLTTLHEDSVCAK